MGDIIIHQNIITRQYAISNGLKKYYTGKPCKRGHVSERYTSTNKCFVCNDIDAKEWKAKNPEKIKESNKKTKQKQGKNRRAAWKKSWDEKNSEHKRIYRKEWYLKNRESSLKYSKEYKKENRILYTALENKRRALKNNITTFLDYKTEDVLFLLKKQNNKCVYCKSHMIKYNVDHIIPIKLGGNNSKYNIQILCPTCNMRKSAKHPIKFAQENGLLL